MVRALVREFMRRTLWREGAIRTILRGPSRGLRYRIYPLYGLSPIYGGWEPDLQRWLVRSLSPGSVAYDIGANYGIHVLLMSRLVGDQGQVFAFEPLADIRAALDENVALNGLRNVTTVPLAADSRNGETVFFTGHHAGAGYLEGSMDRGGTAVVVNTITLDEFVFDLGNPAPDLVKIDVEGAEGRVLLGAQRVLEVHRPVIIVDLHTPQQDIAVGGTFARFGYRALRTDTEEAIERLDSGWPDPKGVWGQVVGLPEPR